MTGPEFTTVFKFICSRCKLPNEYRQSHAPWIRPHLVSTKCSKCRSLNWLGGLTGTLLPPELSPSALKDSVRTTPDGGGEESANKPPD
jgi:hypothetical protein